jgi:hypothetical protein
MPPPEKRRIFRSVEAARACIGPKQRWCPVCHCIVSLQGWQMHLKSPSHNQAAGKLKKLDALGIDMWEDYQEARAAKSLARRPGR